MGNVIRYLYGIFIGFKMKLREGQMAKNFELSDKDGKIWKLFDFHNKYIVLYFYPKDDTPGCTIEANEFTRDLEEYDKLDTKIIGISGGDDESKRYFCKKFDIKVLLLSDNEYNASRKFGAYDDRRFLGQEFKGINRVSFIIDRSKKIIKVYGKVNVNKHSGEILEYIRELEKDKDI